MYWVCKQELVIGIIKVLNFWMIKEKKREIKERIYRERVFIYFISKLCIITKHKPLYKGLNWSNLDKKYVTNYWRIYIQVTYPVRKVFYIISLQGFPSFFSLWSCMESMQHLVRLVTAASGRAFPAQVHSV